MINTITNYEKTKISMANIFLQYDQEIMIKKFSLEHDSNWLSLTFVNRIYRINRQTGNVQWSNDAFETVYEADYNEAMTIYDVLCYSKDGCHLALELHNACIALSGKELDKGDVAFELKLFSFLPIIIRFWEADDEFPTSLQILVDRNILDYMHYETLMFALTHLFHRIKEMQNEKR